MFQDQWQTIGGRRVFVPVIEWIFGPLTDTNVAAGIQDAYAMGERNRDTRKRAAAKRHHSYENEFPSVDVFPALRAQDKRENYSVADARSGQRTASSWFGVLRAQRGPMVVLTDNFTYHFADIAQLDGPMTSAPARPLPTERTL